MDSRQLLNLALTAGEIMLASGAETYRVEDTMKRILQASGCENADAFVTATGIFAGFNEIDKPVAMLRRVKTRSFNMEKIAMVNGLSRKIADGQIPIERAAAELEKIRAKPVYPLVLRVAASGICCLSFCYMFGGGVLDCACAFVTGVLVYLLYNLLNKGRVSGFIVNVVCGAVICACALAAFAGFGDVAVGKVIVGSIMPLVPGLALTNAIRDILEGDYLSGAARMLDAVVTALAIAAGVGFVLKLWFFWGGAPVQTGYMFGYGNYALQAASAFFATAFFAVLFNIPLRELVPAGLTGACGWLIYSPIFASSNSSSIAAFAAVLAVALISRYLAVYRKMPIIVYLAAGVIPFVPGAGIYNTMYNLVINDNAAAAAMGIATCKIAMVIAVGIICALSLPMINKVSAKKGE